MTTAAAEQCVVCSRDVKPDSAICMACGKPVHDQCREVIQIWSDETSEYCRRCAASQVPILEQEKRADMLDRLKLIEGETRMALGLGPDQWTADALRGILATVERLRVVMQGRGSKEKECQQQS